MTLSHFEKYPRPFFVVAALQKAAVERNEVGLGFLPPSKELELKNRHPDIR